MTALSILGLALVISGTALYRYLDTRTAAIMIWVIGFMVIAYEAFK